jgi:hypothetical protein
MEQELFIETETISLDALDDLISAISEALAALDRDGGEHAVQAHSVT